jgi:hypothetical protein
MSKAILFCPHYKVMLIVADASARWQWVAETSLPLWISLDVPMTFADEGYL